MSESFMRKPFQALLDARLDIMLESGNEWPHKPDVERVVVRLADALDAIETILMEHEASLNYLTEQGREHNVAITKMIEKERGDNDDDY